MWLAGLPLRPLRLNKKPLTVRSTRRSVGDVHRE